jgi:hypothetical protein
MPTLKTLDPCTLCAVCRPKAGIRPMAGRLPRCPIPGAVRIRLMEGRLRVAAPNGLTAFCDGRLIAQLSMSVYLVSHW